jgi:hypothetical protein
VSISTTLHEEINRLRRSELEAITAIPERSLRDVCEGGPLLLASGISQIVLVWAAPEWMLRFKSPWRTAIFCLLCTACAGAILGTWKLAAPIHTGRWRSDDLDRWLLRASVIALLGFLLTAPMLYDYKHPLYLSRYGTATGLLRSLSWCFPILGAAFFLTIRRAARQLGASRAATVAGLLACIAPALLLILSLESLRHRDYFNSLELLAYYLPIPAGPAGLWVSLVTPT